VTIENETFGIVITFAWFVGAIAWKLYALLPWWLP
jgi:hypothetical protein